MNHTLTKLSKLVDDTLRRESARMPLQLGRVLHRKSKMVSFRVSLEDYERLRLFCASQGQRSVSDFARLAVTSTLERPGIITLASRVSEAEGRIAVLTHKVSHLVDLVDSAHE